MKRKGSISIHKHEIIVISLAIAFFFGIFLISFDSVNLSPTGNMISKVQIEKAEDDFCNFTLTENENLISFHCVRGAMPRSMMLEPIDGKYEAAFTYNPNSLDAWKSYNPSLPAWVEQDLTLIEDTTGLWLFMKEDTNYIYNGSKPNTNITTLVNGWNLIGYPTPISKDMPTAVASINGNYNIILAYNSSRYCLAQTLYIDDTTNYNGKNVKLVSVNNTFATIEIEAQTIDVTSGTRELFSSANNLPVRIYNLHYEALESSRYAEIGIDCETPDIDYLNQTSDKWESHGLEGDGTLKNMTPDRGYWVYMTSDDDLIKTW